MYDQVVKCPSGEKSLWVPREKEIRKKNAMVHWFEFENTHYNSNWSVIVCANIVPSPCTPAWDSRVCPPGCHLQAVWCVGSRGDQGVERGKEAPEGRRHPASKCHPDARGSPLHKQKHHHGMINCCARNHSREKHNSITGVIMCDKAK